MKSLKSLEKLTECSKHILFSLKNVFYNTNKQFWTVESHFHIREKIKVSFEIINVACSAIFDWRMELATAAATRVDIKTFVVYKGIEN